MPGYVLLDHIKLEHAERVRKAERDRMYLSALKAHKRPTGLKSLLRKLVNG